MTKEQKVDNVDLDDGLDFQDFEMGFEELDGSREPKSEPVKSFAKGVKKGLTDTDQIKSVFRKNLPKEYGRAFDILDDVASGTQTFAKEVIDDAKPIINDIAYAADKFLPQNFVKTKEKLQRLQEWAKDDKRKSEGMSKEEMQNASIGVELGRIFDQQQKVELIKEKLDKKDKALDRGLSIAQHKDILSVLIKNANANISSSSFLTTVNSAWQRKSLETQYRTLFTIKDLLDEQKQNNAKIVGSLAAITKNTALPEYRKTEQDEAFLQEARARFSSKLIDASHNFFQKGIKKFQSDVKGTVNDLASFSGMLAMAGDMHAMEQEFDPKTLEDKLAGMGGSYLGKYIVGKGGSKLFDLVKTKPELVQKILKGSNILKSLQDNGAGMFKEYIGSKADEGSDLFRYLNDIFEFEKQDNTVKTYDYKKMFEPAVFTNKFTHSVTDVIPGYLARILQQSMIANGVKGRDAELVKFDYIKNKFSTSNQIIKDIQKTISPEQLSKSSEYYFKESLGKIESRVELDAEERKQTAKALLEIGSNGSSLLPGNMTNPDFWADHVDTYDLASKIAQAMEGIYGTTSNEDYLKGRVDVNTHRNSQLFQDSVRSLNGLKKDFRPQAQTLIDFGLQDEATKAGLLENGRINYDLINKNIASVTTSFKGSNKEDIDYVKEYTDGVSSRGNLDDNFIDKVASSAKRKFTKKDKDGNLIVGWTDKNEPIIGYENDDRSRPIIGTSDINKKTDIREPKGSVLERLAKTPISLWRYKDKYEDGGATTNMGPMAQDLKKNFGEEVAPGGTTIDLVNANGVVMKAVQELDQKMKTIFGDPQSKDPESSFVPQNQLSALRGIYYNTTVLTKQQQALVNISSESLKSIATGLGTALGKVDLTALGEAAQRNYGEAVKFVKENSASSILGRLGDFISKQTEEGFSRGNVLAKSGYSKVSSSASSIFKTLNKFSDNIKLKALETFDVYVKGEKEPRMINLKIRNDRYLDFSNDLKPIKTRDEIKKIESVIVEVDENGNIINTVLSKEELENVYFVNVYKSLVEKAFDSSVDFITKGVKRGFSLGLKAITGAYGLSKKVNSTLLNIIDQPVDIYIKDKLDNPVLLAKKMRAGVYVGLHSNEIITRPSMIKGGVYDSEKKEIALSNDEFRQGLVDIYNKPISKHAVLGLAGKALGVGLGVSNWAFGKIAKMPGILGNLARTGSGMLKNIFGNIPGISFGFFGQESVEILRDIRGILQYKTGLGGDLKQLSKLAGKTVKPSQENKVTPISKNLLQPIGGLTTFTPRAAANENVNAPRAANDERMPSSNGDPTTLFKIAGAVGSIGGSIVDKIRGKKTQEPQTQETVAQNNSQEKEGLFNKLSKKITTLTDKVKESDTVKKATEISSDGRQYVNGLRKGSWQERLANLTNKNKEVIKDKNEVRKYATKNIFAMIADMVGSVKKKLSDWVGSKKDPVELAGDIADGMGDTDRKETRKERKERERRERRENSNGKKGFFRKPGGLISGALRIGAGAYAANAAYDAVNNVADGNYGQAALDTGKAAISGTYAAGGLAGLAGGAARFGKAAFSKVGLKALGVAGLGYGAYSAYDNFSKGHMADGALDTALTVGGAALMLGKGGALAGLLFNPVTLGIGAAALTGYLAYKGYKRLTRKEFNFTEKMRMIEYGLRGADDDLMRIIHEFETYVSSVSKTTEGQWQLDDKKFKLEDALSIFSIDKTNAKKVDDFTFWLATRFKPIFGKWKVLTKEVLGSDNLDSIEKASNEKLFELYKGFRLTPEAYVVTRSPFVNMKINGNPQVVSSMRDQWLMSLKDKAKEQKDNKTGQAIADTGKAIVEARASGKSADEVLDSLKGNKTTINNNLQSITKPNEITSKILVNSTVDAGAMSLFSSNSLSALQAVLMKTYGLTDLRLNDIISIRNLEVAVNPYIKIDSSGRAVFEYDPLKILEKVAGYFGITTNDEYSQTWVTWFKNRFLPVYLNYHTCLYTITKRNNIKDNLLEVEKFKASQALTVAKFVMGTMGVWSVKEYCFKGQSANTNTKVCESNISFLQNKTKDEIVAQEQTTLSEHKVKTTTNNVADNLGIKIPTSTVNDKPAIGLKSGGLNVKETVSAPAEYEDPKLFDKPTGTTKGPSSSTISSGAVSNLSAASGDLMSGSGAMQYLNFAKNARLEGVHPSIKRLFLGMVEEYGQLTGKKITLNQGFRTYDEQAALYKKDSGKATRPGTSLHEFGLALDVQTVDLDQLDKLGLLRKYGFTRPLGSETWHLEAAGIHDPSVRAKAKKDHNYATSFIESGIGRGGGGLGAKRGGNQVVRDDKYAQMLFNAASKPVENNNETKPASAPASSIATKAANNDLGTTKLTTSLNPEAEASEGKINSAIGSISSSITKPKTSGSSDSTIGDMPKANYEITSDVKGTVKGYSSLPESTGRGWSGNGLLIKEAAKLVGVDPAVSAAIAAKESSLNPQAIGSVNASGNNPAQGLYQFMPGTWQDMMKKYAKKYGIPENATPLDARANALLGMEYIKANSQAIGSEPHNTYLGHFLGTAGAKRFMALADSDIPAKSFASQAANNPQLFYHNGDKSKPKNKQEFIESIKSSLQKQLVEFKIPLTVGSTAVASNKEAANDSGDSDKITLSKAGAGSGEPDVVQVKSSPAKYDRPATMQPAVYNRQTPAQNLTRLENAQPVASASLKNAAPTAKAKSDYERLEKTTQEHVKVSLRTNELLEEIKDVLVQGFAAASSARSSAPVDNAPTTRGNQKTPVDLPQSYVQRKRIA